MKRLSHLHMLCVAGLLVLLTGCGSGITPPPPRPVPPASMFVEHEGNFCGREGGDKFAVGYYGSNPLDTLVYLYIVCHQRDTVYRASYPGEWFVDGNAGADDSVKVNQVHAKMRAFAEGKLLPPQDSFDVAQADGQPLFGLNLPGHVQEMVYFSAADHKVHVLK